MVATKLGASEIVYCKATEAVGVEPSAMQVKQWFPDFFLRPAKFMQFLAENRFANGWVEDDRISQRWLAVPKTNASFEDS